MNDQIQTEKLANPFLPIVLIGLSLVCILGPNYWGMREQKTALENLKKQQVPVLDQSRQVQVRFQKMMMDLLQLAQTDKEAQALVTKYGIAVQPPAR